MLPSDVLSCTSKCNLTPNTEASETLQGSIESLHECSIAIPFSEGGG